MQHTRNSKPNHPADMTRAERHAAKRKSKRVARKLSHRILSAAGVPRHKDGNRLGPRKRRMIYVCTLPRITPDQAKEYADKFGGTITRFSGQGLFRRGG